MYISNGFVYGGQPTEQIKIEAIKNTGNSILLVSFNNGETRLFDATLLEGDVFAPLKDENILNDCVIEYGVPTWCDGQIDCAPEYIYNNSFEYSKEI